MTKFDCTYGIYMHMCRKFTLKCHLFTIHGTELYILFQEHDYVFSEGDQEGSVMLRWFGELQNSFTVTLYTVTITEARDPAGFNVSNFIWALPEDAQATPGEGVVLSQRYKLTLTMKSVGPGMEKHDFTHGKIFRRKVMRR